MFNFGIISEPMIARSSNYWTFFLLPPGPGINYECHLTPDGELEIFSISHHHPERKYPVTEVFRNG
jgi:hypothetical protein